MLTQACLFKLKHLCNMINMMMLILLLLPSVPALPPSTSSFYTEFEVSAPANSTLIADIMHFVDQLCAAMPILPCAANHNVTIA